MKITKSQLIKIIKEEIQELGYGDDYSKGLKQIASELEEMIVSRLGAEDVTVDIDEWGPTEYDEPAGGEIRVSWKVGAIDAGSVTEASLADESDLERAKHDHFTAAHDQATAAAQNFEELARQDETGLMHDIQRKYIDLFKSGGNEFGDLGPLAVIAIANAYSLVNK